MWVVLSIVTSKTSPDAVYNTVLEENLEETCWETDVDSREREEKKDETSTSCKIEGGVVDSWGSCSRNQPSVPL